MDLSAIIIVLGGSALFFGFIVWMAIHSRKNNSQDLPEGVAEFDFSEVGNKNKQHLGKESG